MTSRQLHGWKDIAGYLGRSVRAAQRWEKQLGLPVHRIPTQAGHAVYAISEELDAWRAQAESRYADSMHALDDDLDNAATGDECEAAAGQGGGAVAAASSPLPASAGGSGVTAGVLPSSEPAVPPVVSQPTPSPPASRRWGPLVAAVGAIVGLLVLVAGTARWQGRVPPGEPTPAASASYDSGPWPVQGADARSSGQSRLVGPGGTPTARVVFDAGSQLPYSRPIVATSRGTFIIGTCDGRVIAFDESGRVAWQQTLDRTSNTEAATGLALSKQLLLVSVADCPHARETNARTQFTAMSFVTGAVMFRHRSGAQTVPPQVGRDGAAYQPDHYGTLRKYDEKGTVLWTTDFAGFGTFTPLQGPDGRLYIVTDGALFGQQSRHIVTDEGRVAWSGGDGALVGPALATNGDLVAIDRATNIGGLAGVAPMVRRFDPSGREVWRVPLPEGLPPGLNPELALPASGDILVRTATHLVALGPQGTRRWSAGLPEGPGGSPGAIVDRDGNVYVAAGGRVVSFTADGRPRWEVDVSSFGRQHFVPIDGGYPGPGRLIIGSDGLLLVTMETSVLGVQDTTSKWDVGHRVRGRRRPRHRWRVRRSLAHRRNSASAAAIWSSVAE